jgi:hypothetical protein
MTSADLTNAYDPQASTNDIGTTGSDPTFFLNEPRCLAEVRRMPL